MIRFACPGCSATFTVTDEKAGKTGKCPKCQTQFTIPAAAVEEAIIPPPPPAVEPPPPMTSVEAPPPMPPPVEAPPPFPPPVEPPPPIDAPPPPVAPAPPGPNDPVEIVPCPKCSSRLSVLPSDVGLDVECPNCQTVYRANRADAPPPPVLDSKPRTSSLVKYRADAPPPPVLDSKPRTSSLVKYGSGAKSKSDDDDDDDRPSRRKKSRRDDDDDDDDDRPRRRSRSRGRSRRRNYEDHRGMLILIFGILGFFFSVIFAIIAWILGSMDLKAMDAGRMDPEGRQQTQIGMYLGMASVALHVLGILAFCIIWGCILGAAGGAAGGGR